MSDAGTRYENLAALDPPVESSWGKILALVPRGARVLDVGCATGTFAAALARLRGCTVVGVEIDPDRARTAAGRCEEVILGEISDLVAAGRVPDGFDVVVAADVLEHLRDPAAALCALATRLKPGGVLLASVPNVTHFSVLAELGAGRFPRGPEGLLDATHVHFFGEVELLALFQQAGYAARLADRVRLDPRLTEFRTDLGKVPDEVRAFLDHPNSDTYQFIVRAVPAEWATAADGPEARPEAQAVLPVSSTLASQLARAETLGARYHEALEASICQCAQLERQLARLGRVREQALALQRTARQVRLGRTLEPGVRDRLRVLYVTDRWDPPYRYRVVGACEQLRRSGIAANVFHVADPHLLEVLPGYSLVVLFRLGWTDRVAQIAGRGRQCGARIAFDIDDRIFIPTAEVEMPFLQGLPQSEVEQYREMSGALRRTAEEADVVITSTPALAALAGELGKEALLYPNLLAGAHLDQARFLYPLRGLLARRPVIGYMSGSNTHDRDLASIAGALARVLDRRQDVSLLICGHVALDPSLAPYSGRILRVPFLPFVVYPWLMARCRAIVAPIETLNEFSHSKSAIKVFEANVLGVPVVATPIDQYAAAIVPGITGFLASTEDEWAEALLSVLDAGTSARMGAAARRLALAEHSPAPYRDVLARQLNAVAGEAVGPPPALRRIETEEAGRLGSAGKLLKALLAPSRLALQDLELRPWDAADLKVALAHRHLRGKGIEIGALQNPLRLPQGAEVRYCDRLTSQEAREHYPELAGQPLIEPEIVCEGDRLAPLESESEDFVVACHVLEHTKDPIGALREWLRVLKPGGHLFLAVPDSRNPHDRLREIVTLDHLVADHERRSGRAEADRHHFREWAESAYRDEPPEVRLRRAGQLADQGYAIHFHAFDRVTLAELLAHVCGEEGAEVKEFHDHQVGDLVEYLAIVRKPEHRGVDIVVPIYNAREDTVRCVESVLRHARGDWRLVLVDDASTDPGLQSFLAGLREQRVVVLRNETNQGFVSSANRGMRHAGTRDVLLLNSDTAVGPEFLGRLAAAAYADAATGVVSPFSNNATLCSIPPHYPQGGPLPAGHTVESLARLIAAMSRRLRPELVTAVGFCMYIRRAALDAVGYFDEETFGRGFGEENDFCERARKAGLSIRLADDVFVFHQGKRSFGAEGLELEARHGKILEARHPGYGDSVERFFAQGSLAVLHEHIGFHLARRTGQARGVLFLLHTRPFSGDPGGAEYHVRDLVRCLALPRAVIAYPRGAFVEVAEVYGGRVAEPVLYSFPVAAPAGRYCLESPEVEALIRHLLDVFDIGAAHIHHLMFWPVSVGRVLRGAGIPFLYTSHDFYCVCPSWNLFDHSRGESCPCRPETDGAATCISALARQIGEAAVPEAVGLRDRHRAAFRETLAGASAIVWPSRAAADHARERLDPGDVPFLVVEPGYDGVVSVSRKEPGDRLRVAVIGAVATPIKGAERYRELIDRTRHLPIEWHFFGPTGDYGFEARLRGLGLADRLVCHGPYRREDIVDHLVREGIELFVALPLCHETFCFTLSEAWLAGVPALVSAGSGALSQRVTDAGHGAVVAGVAEAAETLAGICRDRAILAEWTRRARDMRYPTVAESAARYRDLYERFGLLASVAAPPGRLVPDWLAELSLRRIPGSRDSSLDLDRRTPWYQDAPWYRLYLHVKPLVPRSLRRLGKSLLLGWPGRRMRRLRLPGDAGSLSGVRLLRGGPGIARFEALSDDPQFLLAVQPLVSRDVRSLRFRLRHFEHGRAFAQLFWTHAPGEIFSERRSAKIGLGVGAGRWGDYTVRLDAPDLASGWLAGERIFGLRFDPINVAGPFEIGALEFRP